MIVEASLDGACVVDADGVADYEIGCEVVVCRLVDTVCDASQLGRDVELISELHGVVDVVRAWLSFGVEESSDLFTSSGGPW